MSEPHKPAEAGGACRAVRRIKRTAGPIAVSEKTQAPFTSITSGTRVLRATVLILKQIARPASHTPCQRQALSTEPKSKIQSGRRLERQPSFHSALHQVALRYPPTLRIVTGPRLRDPYGFLLAKKPRPARLGPALLADQRHELHSLDRPVGELLAASHKKM